MITDDFIWLQNKVIEIWPTLQKSKPTISYRTVVNGYRMHGVVIER